MALQVLNESDEEEYHSVESGHRREDATDDEAESTTEPPVHPVPSMQGAFEESIVESTEGDDTVKVSERAGAETRRQKLLEAKQYDDAWTTRWKQKAGAQYHPLLKLMAQIVFGMHLLQQQQAKSNEEVVKILQTHVNEVDSFLERTSEDFDLAIADIEERIRHLKLPMAHLDVFNIMLDDKKFRTQLLDGNDKIEKIIDRTAKAMNAALTDVKKGLRATQQLAEYLSGVKERWPQDKSGITDVFGAMQGNEQGWKKYLRDLQTKGKNLGNNLVQLGTVLGELSRLAAAASRRNRPQSRRLSPVRSAPTSPGLRSKFSQDTAPTLPAARQLSLNKPLPREPNTIGGAAQFAIPKPHPVPFAQRYEQPRQSPQSPAPRNRRISEMPNGTPQRPRTAGAQEQEAQRYSKCVRSPELEEFLRHSGPLRSNPPDAQLSIAGSENMSTAEKKVSRSRSQGANRILNTPAAQTAEALPISRPKSQGTAMVFTSRPSSRGAEKALSVKSPPSSRKDPFTNTGFARRLSARMKHLQPVQEHDAVKHDAIKHPAAPPTPAPAPAPALTDSAYSSGTDRQADSKEEIPTSPAPPLQRWAKTFAGEAPNRTDSTTRPPSRLGLFPRTPEPLTPSAASIRSNGTALHSANNPGQLPNMTTATSMNSGSTKGRTLSLRNIFHRKRESRNVFA